MQLILASGSPRRRQLLEQIGIDNFSIRVSDVDETIAPGTDPGAAVELLSRRKAEAVAAQSGPDALVLAADTVVALGEDILGKPQDEDEAFSMLCALSGTTHRVYTGITLMGSSFSRTEHEVTSVTFRPLEEEEMRRYIATGEPMDKAGAYGIQGYGALLVSRLEGDYFNVMGLPLCRLGQLLQDAGVALMPPGKTAE